MFAEGRQHERRTLRRWCPVRRGLISTNDHRGVIVDRDVDEVEADPPTSKGPVAVDLVPTSGRGASELLHVQMH